MTSERRFCTCCREETLHDVGKEVEGTDRLFWGVVTFGLNEFINEDIRKCQKCGRKTYGTS